MRTHSCPRRLLAGGMLAGLLAVLLPIGAGAQPPAPAPGAGAAGTLPVADASRTITLVTGDRVLVGAAGNRSVQPGEDRDHITFVTRRDGEHEYVFPSDAMPLIATGRLDQRLFDVALLAELGYGDDRRDDLPVIVTGPGAGPGVVRSSAGRAGAARVLPAVDGVAVPVDKAGATDFWDRITGAGGARTLTTGVSRVWLDGLRQPALDHSVPQVGAPAAWESGLDGSGVTVAVLDTGIDASHPDLAGRVVASANFTQGYEDERDLVGHGTHVASTIAGSGAASDGRYRGVAPGAELVDGKVCAAFGCPDSWVLAGMQWAAEHGVSVVNLSLGGEDRPELDLLEQAVQTLTEQYGVLFVVAAGNDGEDATIQSPASADAALAVGAVDGQDALADLSSRGPRVDGALKPDLTAPGVGVVAARSSGSDLGAPGEPYTALSGTSMAAPHVAGAAAILAQQHPDWTPERYKAALMGSAIPNPVLGPFAQGAGRLDVARAVTQRVTSSPPSVSFDYQLWPHHDDRPQTRTVTYTNRGAADLTLTLELATAGPGNGPAPAGMFDIDASSVTVPAGGSAALALTVDTTTAGDAAGGFGGRITATAPGVTVTTPFAVDVESEAYDVTLTHLDRGGAPTSTYLTALDRLDAGGTAAASLQDSTTTLRVPPGEYALVSAIGAAPGSRVTVLAQPSLTVDSDRSIVLDARDGRPISVGLPEPTAEPVLAEFRVRVPTGPLPSFFGTRASSLENIFTARLGPDRTVDGFTVAAIGSWAKRNTDGTFAGTPYAYHLAWPVAGRMVTGLDRDVRRRDLARVVADHGAQVAGTVGGKGTKVVLPGFGSVGGSVTLPAELPFRRIEYYNAAGGVRWHSHFEEVLPGDSPALVGSVSSGPAGTGYRPGHRYHETWNYGVFGPALPEPLLPDEWPSVSRYRDRLIVHPSLYGDGAGHGDNAGLAWPTPATATTRVFRDGELIAEEPSRDIVLDVPPEPAGYRIEIEAERSGPAPLSTRTSLAWEFRSGHVPGDAPLALPVSVVRFSPRLDPAGTAPAGLPFLVPVAVEPQPGSDPGRVGDLAVAVSYDDGVTWWKAPVLGNRYVLLWHPRGDGFVSLRTTATDRHGNSVEQTILRAYRIG